ncbi:MAG: hypothetical protein V3W41_22135 [Planctomycetota bacterium]
MPRIVGLGLMAGGNFALTYGLGHNGLEEVAFYTRSEISLNDAPCTLITAADSPLTCVTTFDDALTFITATDAGPGATIELTDQPATIITAADGKDGL